MPPGYGFRLDERIIEYPWLLSRIPDNKGKLLDAGSTLNFDFILSRPRLRIKDIFISTLAPEAYCFWNAGISYIFEDLRNLCFRDEYFDWVACISTIEHVGLDNTMLYVKDPSKKENNPLSCLEVVKQFHRVLKPGGILYLSFPFGKYKNHSWFQVFDSKMVDAVIEAFSPSYVIESYFKYDPQGWRPSSREDSKDATCFDIHQQSSYEKDFLAFSRAIACLELTK